MNENCPTCLELVKENPLKCNHKVHMHCLIQQFNPECPLCRCKLNIKVYGKKPESNIPYSIQEYEENENDSDWNGDLELERELDDFINQDVDNTNSDFSDDELNWRQKGFLYKEEDPDYDEENPDGDCVEYY